MSGPFAPLDLSGSLNAGTGNYALGGDRYLWPFGGDDTDATPLASSGFQSGECLFWGVPFHFAADDAERRFVIVSKAKGVDESVTIAVTATPRRILFAHACAPCNGHWATIDGASELLGAYRIRYADGSETEQPLRRRWEIHDTHVPWGHHPFLCRNSRNFHSVTVHDRAMPYGMAQVGTYDGYGTPKQPVPERPGHQGNDLMAWWVFDLESAPGTEIREIVLEAYGETPIVLGAITLCDEDSDPLAWPQRHTVAVTVGDSDEAPAVTMDRGVVVRQDELYQPAADFTTTDEAGWGVGGQRRRKGSHLEIHGSLKGKIQVDAEADGKQVAADFPWGEVLEEGVRTDGPVRIEVVGRKGIQWLHVKVEDEDTGEQVGCRVHFRSKQGVYLAPHGHQADVNIAWFEDMGGDCKTNGVPYAYIDGTCQIELPVGTNYVEVVRGFEYEPTRQLIEIKHGQRHLTLKAKRLFDMKANGYYSGDTHVHFLSSQSSVLEAEGEDLNVVNLLASQWGRLFTSWEEFTGGLAPTSKENHLVYVSQENRQHVLGHISLLGLKDLVAPICTGGPNEDWVGGEIQVLMADWAEQCRAQGGLVIMPHMPSPDFENAANIVMGHADAAEMCWIWQGEQIGQGERGYYRWLNVGQKLPIVGGTDKMSNGRILGGSRTYARLADGEEFTYENWCKAVKCGNTFASTGAMIDLRVEGAEMGQEISLTGNGGTVEVEVTAFSAWPLSAVEIIVNGVPDVRETASEQGQRSITFKHKLSTGKSCWVAARCWGPYYTDAGPVMAHSSPVYIDVGKRCAFEKTDGEYLMTHMEGGITWAERIGVFKDEAVRQRLIGLFREAQNEIKRRAMA
ncbi:MAG: CehA/McbA family metallohydrolase [Candidatus Latescibacterota bacterium]|nr:CehA/McbA family metallohydrolase [Candidatus Latescibacterota bacterium]